jgi:glycolate oxidase iron-sulfur subunit
MGSRVAPAGGGAPAGGRERLRELAGVCVHCGFCLPACPTYQLWGEEMDSPRGRIHLLGQLLDGAPVSDGVLGHFDACLGCLACVPACPSGVAYDQIIEETRALLEREARRGLTDRLLRAAIFALFPHPARMRALRGPLGLARRVGLVAPQAGAPSYTGNVNRVPFLAAARWVGRLHPALGAMAELAPPVRPRVRLPRRVPARPDGRPGPARAVVGLLTGCVQSAFFSHVSAATARVLALEGCEVIVPPHQGCCGALARHAGRDELARRQARRTVAAFARAGVDAVVTDVAGCGSMLKEYGHLLRDDPRWAARAADLAARARDVTEVLVGLGAPLAPRHPLPLTVAYHDACHLLHGQRVRQPPRELLGAIPGLTVVPVTDAETCCGSAGVYNLLQPTAAAQLGDRKAAALIATGADVVAAGNPGCLLQIEAALRRRGGAAMPRVRHTVQLLDASLRGQPSAAV